MFIIKGIICTLVYKMFVPGMLANVHRELGDFGPVGWLNLAQMKKRDIL